MPRLVTLPTFEDERGCLTVIEEELGFAIRRLFYIYDVKAKRGGHGHLRARLGLVALNGTVSVTGQTPRDDFSFGLSHPKQALLLEPEDWHEMSFKPGAILLVLASEGYDPSDYFYEPYRKARVE